MEKLAPNMTVVYGTHGVCTVECVQEMEFMGTKSEYFILKPVYDSRSTVYVPTKNEKLVSKIKRIMSADEIFSLISEMPETGSLWVENENERKRLYSEILHDGDRRALVQMIKALHFRKEKQEESKKKLRAADESFLRDGEKLLYEEFAYVLNIKKEQVLPFICEQIEVAKK